MRTFLNETKGDLMRAVGNYHSHTPVLNLTTGQGTERGAHDVRLPDVACAARRPASWNARSRYQSCLNANGTHVP